jgi:hypothetical protein
MEEAVTLNRRPRTDVPTGRRIGEWIKWRLEVVFDMDSVVDSEIVLRVLL